MTQSSQNPQAPSNSPENHSQSHSQPPQSSAAPEQQPPSAPPCNQFSNKEVKGSSLEHQHQSPMPQQHNHRCLLIRSNNHRSKFTYKTSKQLTYLRLKETEFSDHRIGIF